MGNGISGRTPLWKRRLPAELTAIGPPLLGSAVTTVGLLLKPDSVVLGFASASGFAWLLLGSAWKIFQAKRHDDEADSYEGLSAALLVLHATVCHICGFTESRGQHLRVTFHRVVPPVDVPKEIEQLVDYVGGKQNGALRRAPIHCGITGLSVRERSVAVATLVNDDIEELQKELIRDWGYTEEQAKQLTPKRTSLMAVPILAGDGQAALGVVYLDSDVKDIFSPMAVREVIVTACSGITTFIHRRYK